MLCMLSLSLSLSFSLSLSISFSLSLSLYLSLSLSLFISLSLSLFLSLSLYLSPSSAPQHSLRIRSELGLGIYVMVAKDAMHLGDNMAAESID